MSNPIPSIIMPTYNRLHLLPHAVKSALAQTLDDLEVIVAIPQERSHNQQRVSSRNRE
jgi:GT2 family glycosyltransferase